MLKRESRPRYFCAKCGFTNDEEYRWHIGICEKCNSQLSQEEIKIIKLLTRSISGTISEDLHNAKMRKKILSSKWLYKQERIQACKEIYFSISMLGALSSEYVLQSISQNNEDYSIVENWLNMSVDEIVKEGAKAKKKLNWQVGSDSLRARLSLWGHRKHALFKYIIKAWSKFLRRVVPFYYRKIKHWFLSPHSWVVDSERNLGLRFTERGLILVDEFPLLPFRKGVTQLELWVSKYDPEKWIPFETKIEWRLAGKYYDPVEDRERYNGYDGGYLLYYGQSWDSVVAYLRERSLRVRDGRIFSPMWKGGILGVIGLLLVQNFVPTVINLVRSLISVLYNLVGSLF